MGGYQCQRCGQYGCDGKECAVSPPTKVSTTQNEVDEGDVLDKLFNVVDRYGVHPTLPIPVSELQYEEIHTAITKLIEKAALEASIKVAQDAINMQGDAVAAIAMSRKLDAYKLQLQELEGQQGILPRPSKGLQSNNEEVSNG